jgi:hypothetical protein
MLSPNQSEVIEWHPIENGTPPMAGVFLITIGTFDHVATGEFEVQEAEFNGDKWTVGYDDEGDAIQVTEFEGEVIAWADMPKGYRL